MTKFRTLNCYHVFQIIMKALETNDVSLEHGGATLAYALGYARGLSQHPIMDETAMKNISLGWAHGASIDITELLKPEPRS